MKFNQTKIEGCSNEEGVIDAYVTWLNSLSKTDWDLFAVTAVFRSSGNMPCADKFKEHYKHKVLWKIKKRIHKRKAALLHAIPYEDLHFYEFSESSRFRITNDKRQPHHVHGIVPIRKYHSHKVWDKQKFELKDGLVKDFKSIKDVSSVLMEPVNDAGIKNWINYITKRKSIMD